METVLRWYRDALPWNLWAVPAGFWILAHLALEWRRGGEDPAAAASSAPRLARQGGIVCGGLLVVAFLAGGWELPFGWVLDWMPMTADEEWRRLQGAGVSVHRWARSLGLVGLAGVVGLLALASIAALEARRRGWRRVALGTGLLLLLVQLSLTTLLFTEKEATGRPGMCAIVHGWIQVKPVPPEALRAAALPALLLLLPAAWWCLRGGLPGRRPPGRGPGVPLLPGALCVLPALVALPAFLIPRMGGYLDREVHDTWPAIPWFLLTAIATSPLLLGIALLGGAGAAVLVKGMRDRGSAHGGDPAVEAAAPA